MARSILHEGVLREFRVYTPPDWMEIPPIPTPDPLYPSRSAVPLPVVVVFHGGNSSVDKILGTINFHSVSRLAVTSGGGSGLRAPVPDDDKFITIYVQGLGLGAGGLPLYGSDNPSGGGSWNDGGPTGHLGDEATVHRADDVGLVHRILNLLSEELTAAYWAVHEGEYPWDEEGPPRVIDASRVFLTGFSGGAGLVYRLAADPSAYGPLGSGFRFAAMAPVAGTAGGFRHRGDRFNEALKTNWDPALASGEITALHILAIHGTHDPTVGSQYDKAKNPLGYQNDPFLPPSAPERPHTYLLPDEMTLGWTNDPAPGLPAPDPPTGDASFTSSTFFLNGSRYDPDLGLLIEGLGYSEDQAKDLARWDLYLDASLALWTRFMAMADVEPDRLEPDPDNEVPRESYPQGFVNTSAVDDVEGGDTAFRYSDPPVGTVPLYGGKVVRVILLDGEKHTWPRPGEGERFALNIDATREIWSFFKEVSFL